MMPNHTMHPRDVFRLRRGQNFVVLQRLFSTSPLAAPAREWRDISPDDLVEGASLAGIIHRRLNPTNDIVVAKWQPDAQPARREMLRGIAIGAVLGIGGAYAAAALYMRIILS